MIELLKHIGEASRCRDRDLIAQRIVSAIFELLAPRSVLLFHVESAATGPLLVPVMRRNHNGLEILLGSGDDDEDTDGGHQGVPLERYPLLLKGYREGIGEALEEGEMRTVWAVRPTSSGLASTLLVVESERSLSAIEKESIACLLAFFGNHLDLLDYSELDTLTGLSNRKTYDEAFDRVLAAIPADHPVPPDKQEKRHESDGNKDFWLGVIDIDHFKRVNDNFGHLFGDEVLLRVANLMKQSFRASDKLFRFGGEEFVVLLRPTIGPNAERAFQRFREAVETHEFPQVGRVTCSIGFTRIDPVLQPSDMLGKADEALYFSKENGRNQVHCYESLVARGCLAAKAIESAQPDFDIDALFN